MNGKQRLSIDLSGVSTLEQIVFNKMMLFSTVYHHHKVRAAECLFRSIFEDIVKSGVTMVLLYREEILPVLLIFYFLQTMIYLVWPDSLN